MMSLLFAIAGIFIYLGCKELAPTYGVIAYIPLAFGLLLWTSLGKKVNRIEKKIDYSGRLETALKALKNAGLLRGDTSRNIYFQKQQIRTPKFTLFLRPFSVDHIPTRNPQLDSSLLRFIPLARWNMPEHIDLDEALYFALETNSIFIALSSIPDTFGAVKIARLEDDWRCAIDELSPLADSIIIIPGVREGTIWEIKRLIELKLLTKCIFLFLPHPLIELDFRPIIIQLNSLGLVVPENFSDGAAICVGDAIVFNAAGQIVHHISNVFKGEVINNNFQPERLKQCLAFVKHRGHTERRASLFEQIRGG